jgi:DNA (cytosine-5)-methyltransferase 1
MVVPGLCEGDGVRLLDLHCGEGGAAVGYYRAGFEVVGVDKHPMTRYPFEFHQADSLEYLAEHWREFDAFHASPVCKGYSPLAALYPDREYPDEIAAFRKALQATGKPYVIENVLGAPLQNYVMLCGTMFGLRVIRHRLFEVSPVIWFAPATCSCKNLYTASHRGISSFENGADVITVAGHNFKVKDAALAMGIDWMSQAGISQAVPPAFTEFVGRQLLTALEPRS